MLVKLTSEQVALIGATDASNFAEKFIALVQENKELKDMADSPADFSALEKRIKALEDKPAPASLTEGRVGELITAALPTWAASEGGKKIIGAEASRITAEALAAVGTIPVKANPANPAVDAGKPKNFPEAVQMHLKTGKNKLDAITAAIESHPDEYKAYLASGGKL